MSSVSRNEESCEQRLHAANLSPNDYSLVVSAATALRLLDRKVEAELWYRMVSILFFTLNDECVRVWFEWARIMMFIFN